MADILSQTEIDSLLAAISSGDMSANALQEEESQKKIKVYDFKRALRFSKDQLRSLTRIHENFGRLLSTYFSAQLRTFVKMEVASVEQLPYEEFIRSIPATTTLNVFQSPPFEGRIVMEMNPNIAFSIIDRLMGGIGVESEAKSNLTEIEMIIMERIFRRALDYFRDAWKDIITIEPSHEMLETNPQFLQIVSPNETVAVISFQTEIGETSGMINLCLPHVSLEEVLPKLTAHHWLSTNKKKKDPKEQEAVKQKLKTARLPLSVELGTCEITLQELVNLTPGDVIPLNQSTDVPLVVKLGNRPKFLAHPGTVKGKVAVQISAPIVEGDGEDE